MGGHSQHPDPPVGMDAQPIHLVRADLEHPVCQSDVKPVLCRAERTPVGAHGCLGRRGEFVCLVRADARKHEAAPEVVARQRLRGVGGCNRREVLPLVRGGLGSAVFNGQDARCPSAAGADRHLHDVRAAVPALGAAVLDERHGPERQRANPHDGKFPQGLFERFERTDVVFVEPDAKPYNAESHRQYGKHFCQELRKHGVTS